MKKEQKFEEAMEQLEAIVAKLGDETTPLEEALALYADAAEKVRFCSDKLSHAEIKIAEIRATIAEKEEEDDEV